MELSGSKKDWYRYWFYLRNHDDDQLPSFLPNRAIPIVEPMHWSWGPIADSVGWIRTSTASPASAATVLLGTTSLRRTTGVALPLRIFEMQQGGPNG